MNPSTLSFVLRWQALPFWVGLFVSAISGYLLWTFQPDPPSIASAGIESGVSIFGPTVYVIGVFGGLALIVWAWVEASRLRNGS